MILFLTKLPFLTLCVLFFYYSSLFLFYKILEKNKNASLEKELPVLIGSMIYSIKAGISPISFFLNFKKTDSPLKKTFENLIKRIQAGQSLTNSLMAAKKEIPIKSYNFFFTSLGIALKNGGNICPILEKIKTISLSQNKLKRFIKTKSIQLKIQALVIAVLPLFVFMYMGLTNKEKLMNFFYTPFGLKIFLTALTADIIGILAVYQIINSPLKTKRIEEFLYMLDLISLIMHGGKNLGGAINSLKEFNHTSTVNKFLIQFDNQLKMGKSFLESFKVIKNFFPIKNCNQILFLIEENISHGVSIKNILDELTLETRNEIEGQINTDIEKIPIKLLFPLTLLIAPSTLTLILYPIIFL